MRADAAANAEHRLDEQRRREQAAIQEMRGRVEMADIVALELEPRAVAAAQPQDVGDVLQGVLEEAGFAAGQILRLPVPLPFA